MVLGLVRPRCAAEDQSGSEQACADDREDTELQSGERKLTTRVSRRFSRDSRLFGVITTARALSDTGQATIGVPGRRLGVSSTSEHQSEHA
jgi:hypothetical protein